MKLNHGHRNYIGFWNIIGCMRKISLKKGFYMTLKEFTQHLKKNNAKEDYRLELGKDLNINNKTVNHFPIPIKKHYICIDHSNKRIVLD
jgi:hypothetical protein